MATKTKKKKKMGPPTKLTPAMRTKVLDLVRQGVSQRDIALMKKMPTLKTMTNWKSKDPEFAVQWQQAWEDAADHMGDECLQIADNVADDWEVKHDKDDKPYLSTNKEAVPRSKLRVDTRLRLMESRKPTVYGRRVKVDGLPDILNPEQVAENLKRLFKEAADLRAKDA